MAKKPTPAKHIAAKIEAAIKGRLSLEGLAPGRSGAGVTVRVGYAVWVGYVTLDVARYDVKVTAC